MEQGILQHRISEFFKEKLANEISVVETGKSHKLLTGMEEVYREPDWTRAIANSGTEEFVLETLQYPELSCTPCKVYAGRSEAVLAVCDDVILWLDHHTNDRDFIRFIERERLLGWLPEQWEKLIQLLVETKFAFLFRPQPIRSTSDIPRFPEETIKRLETTQPKQQFQEFLDYLRENEKQIETIAEQITSPTIQHHADGRRIITFFVWTKIMGFVFKLQCVFGGEAIFDYDGVRLPVEFIGHYLRF